MARLVKRCEFCNDEYEPGDAKYCSYECFQEAGNPCRVCGNNAIGDHSCEEEE